MPQPITKQTVGVTQAAEGHFQDAITSLTTIRNTVESAGSALTVALVSDSGTIFGSKLVQWEGDFNDIISKLQWMHDQLDATWRQIMYNEQHSQELAQGITFVPMPL